MSSRGSTSGGGGRGGVGLGRTVSYENERGRELLTRSAGQPLTDRQVANVGGATPGSRVVVDRFGQILVTGPNNSFTATTRIVPGSAEHPPSLYLMQFQTNGKEINLDAARLDMQVRQARALGMPTIGLQARSFTNDITHAPALGFNATLAGMAHEFGGGPFPPGSGATIRDVLASSPANVAWYTAHAANPSMILNTDANSADVAELNAYMRDHGIKPYAS